MCQTDSIEELTMLAEQGNRNAEYAVNRLRAKERQCECLRNELRVTRAELEKVNAERNAGKTDAVFDFVRRVLDMGGNISVNLYGPAKDEG